MIIEVMLEEEDAASCGNVVSFVSYLSRQPAKSRFDTPWDDGLVRLAGCEIIDLAERR